MKASVIRAILAGLAGGLALALANFLTFGLLGGSRRGQTGLLFDPATQSHKVIAVYKEIEPLPYIITRPYLILAGFAVFARLAAQPEPRGNRTCHVRRRLGDWTTNR